MGRIEPVEVGENPLLSLLRDGPPGAGRKEFPFEQRNSKFSR